MSNEEEKRCPLCAEEMDWTDQQLNPCKCGYEVCVWCWHHIMDMAEKDATEGRCPACRTPYDKDRIVGLEANFQRVVANGSSRKQKPPKAKPKPNEGRKDLSNVRVIQRRMAYIIGLPLDLADEELLQRKDYFGQYGKVTKVSLSRTAGGTVQQFINDTCSVYITYSKEEEAVRCIQSVHGYVLEGRLLRASFGTAKYCHAWLRNTPCNNPTCLYLHTVGTEEDSFGKDEVAAVHTRNRVQEIVGATQYLHTRSGNMLPPPVVEHLSNPSASAEDPVCSSGLKDVAYASVASSDHLLYSKDKDGLVRSSRQMATFVDIVGRSCNSVSDKDVNSVEEERTSNLWSDSNHIITKSPDSIPTNSSTPTQLVNGPSNSKLEDSQVFNDQKSNDLIGLCQNTKNYSDRAWWDTEYQNQISVNSHADQDSTRSTCINDGYNEKKFQSLAKSDRIYRSSNSFSNEEIVEHLRRLDNDTLVNNDESFADVESSIISDILSMDLDGCDDSTTVTGLFEGRDRQHGSSWNFQNSDESRFSFAKNDLGSRFSNIGQDLNFSIHQDSRENRDYLYKPQHQASRAQNSTPPGFSMASKPPPGFSSCMRTEQVLSASSGTRTYAPNNHYRSSSNSSNDDLTDPAIMHIGRGKSSTNSFHDDTKLRLFMQHHHQQEPQFSQVTMQHHSHTPQFPNSQNDFYGGLANQHNRFNEAQQQEVQRLGFDGLLAGYGDVFQIPVSGGLYTRVFGM